MKAIKWTAYGDPKVLKLEDTKKPSPKSNELLIRVHNSTVTAGDCRLRNMKVPVGMRFLTRLVFGINKPRKPIPGMDFSGEVEQVGDKVKSFNKGDRVFGTTGVVLGAYASYITINENKAVVKIPDTLSYENAVSFIFGGITALHFLDNKVKIKNGDRVLINGASGSVGTASIQIAKNMGAEITSISSKKNHELVKSLGSDYVIDYRENDALKNGETYDVILDTVGNFSLASCQNSLTKPGKLILINTGLVTILHSFFDRKLVCGVAVESKELLSYLVKLASSGKLKPVIDSVYPLANTADAHRYVDKGHKAGNVVLVMKHKLP